MAVNQREAKEDIFDVVLSVQRCTAGRIVLPGLF